MADDLPVTLHREGAVGGDDLGRDRLDPQGGGQRSGGTFGLSGRVWRICSIVWWGWVIRFQAR